MKSAQIKGIGIVSPAGSDEKSFAESIRRGYCPIKPLSDARVPEGQRAVGAKVENDEVPQGRAFRMLERAVRQALEDAGIRCPTDCALFLGTSLGDMDTTLENHRMLVEHGQSKNLAQDIRPDELCKRLAESLQINGPQVTLSCACTSGTSALGMALDWIRLGRSKRCIVSAVDSLNDFVLCGFSSLWALTADTARPFDIARTGMALGETAAAIVVEEGAETSLERPARATLSGYGASGDAVHITAPDRKGRGAEKAIVSALKDAQWSIEEVDYMNVHATGSLYNDSMILRAMRSVFKENAEAIPLSSVNPCTGHTLGAAGLAEVLATLLSMESAFVPPTPNLSAPEDDTLHIVKDMALEKRINRAISLTTGFGGANTAIALALPQRS